MEKLVQVLNTSLQSVYVRGFIFMLAGVYMGYTLQPVPEWLNDLFNTSNPFKFVILFFTSIAATYPLNNESVMVALVSSFVVLTLFEVMRNNKLNKNEQKNV